MRHALTLVVLAALPVSAGTRFVGGGLEIGPTAPIYSPVTDSTTRPIPRVMVSQLLYTQVELGFFANTHIIDVAWRKEDLGPMTGAGGCAVQVYMKNVTRQMGPFTVGTTQPLADALMNAQKIIDRPGGALPSTMGFVTLDAVENQFDFVYLGDGLEVTIVTDCRGAAAPITTAPFRWRYDVVPERVRTVSAQTTDALVLTAEPLLSSLRPHTRFRTLVETPGIEIRVAGNVLPNGGTFAVAPKHFAAALPAPFAFQLVNLSTSAVTINSLVVGNQTNGAGSTMVTTPVVVMGGQALDTPLIFTPAQAAQLARFSVTWNTTAGNHTNTFQGTPTAQPEPQPSAAYVRPDGTQQTLMPMTTLQLGNFAAGQSVDVTTLAQNFGQGNIAARVQVLTGEGAQVLTPETMVGTQTDVPFTTRVRTPMTPGPFTVTLVVTVGSAMYTVRLEGTVNSPDIKVTVALTGAEIANQGLDAVERESDAPTTRDYVVANAGSAPLHVALDQVRDGWAGPRPYGLPKVLAPGESRRVTLPMAKFELGYEPYESFVLSDDPDEMAFVWNTESRFATGRPRLVMFVAGTGGEGNGIRASVNRNDDVTVVGARVTITLQNAGDVPLTVTSIAFECDNCEGPAPALPLTIEPGGEVNLEPKFSDAERHNVTVSVDSDDPDGLYAFSFERRNSRPICSVAPGPMMLVLAAWVFSRRRKTAP